MNAPLPDARPRWGFPATITVVRASEVLDREGNHVRDWTTATRTTITGLSIQPAATSETLADDRDHTTTAWQIYSAPGHEVAVDAGDRVEWDGQPYEVTGAPAQWPDPITPGRTHHTEFTITRITG